MGSDHVESSSCHKRHEVGEDGPTTQCLSMMMPQVGVLSASSHNIGFNSKYDNPFHISSDDALENVLRRRYCFETADGYLHRDLVLTKLQNLFKQWMQSVSLEQGIHWRDVDLLGGRITTYGSHMLQVCHKGADIDALCVAPCHISRSDYFKSFYELLRSQSEVEDIRSIEEAYVPVLKLKYDGMEIDMTFARLSISHVPENLNDLSDDNLNSMEPKCLRSLNGYRSTAAIIERVTMYTSVPLPVFRLALRAIKLWAKCQGLYSNILGYLGGFSWAMMVARTCLSYPDTSSATQLIDLFFIMFSQWPWPTPVTLNVPPSSTTNSKAAIRANHGVMDFNGNHVSMPLPVPSSSNSSVFSHNINIGDQSVKSHVMPVITPTQPHFNSTFNVSYNTRCVIQSKMMEARRCITNDIIHSPYYHPTGLLLTNSEDNTGNLMSVSPQAGVTEANTLYGLFGSDGHQEKKLAHTVSSPVSLMDDKVQMMNKCQMKLNLAWMKLFKNSHIFHEYDHFIMVIASAVKPIEWFGLIESKIRHFISSVERELASCVQSARIWPKPFTQQTRVSSSSSSHSKRNGGGGSATPITRQLWFVGIHLSDSLRDASPPQLSLRMMDLRSVLKTFNLNLKSQAIKFFTDDMLIDAHYVDKTRLRGQLSDSEILEIVTSQSQTNEPTISDFEGGEEEIQGGQNGFLIDHTTDDYYNTGFESLENNNNKRPTFSLTPCNSPNNMFNSVQTTKTGQIQAGGGSALTHPPTLYSHRREHVKNSGHRSSGHNRHDKSNKENANSGLLNNSKSSNSHGSCYTCKNLVTPSLKSAGNNNKSSVASSSSDSKSKTTTSSVGVITGGGRCLRRGANGVRLSSNSISYFVTNNINNTKTPTPKNSSDQNMIEDNGSTKNRIQLPPISTIHLSSGGGHQHPSSAPVTPNSVHSDQSSLGGGGASKCTNIRQTSTRTPRHICCCMFPNNSTSGGHVRGSEMVGVGIGSHVGIRVGTSAFPLCPKVPASSSGAGLIRRTHEGELLLRRASSSSNTFFNSPSTTSNQYSQGVQQSRNVDSGDISSQQLSDHQNSYTKLLPLPHFAAPMPLPHPPPNNNKKPTSQSQNQDSGTTPNTSASTPNFHCSTSESITSNHYSLRSSCSTTTTGISPSSMLLGTTHGKGVNGSNRKVTTGSDVKTFPVGSTSKEEESVENNRSRCLRRSSPPMPVRFSSSSSTGGVVAVNEVNDEWPGLILESEKSIVNTATEDPINTLSSLSVDGGGGGPNTLPCGSQTPSTTAVTKSIVDPSISLSSTAAVTPSSSSSSSNSSSNFFFQPRTSISFSMDNFPPQVLVEARLAHENERIPFSPMIHPIHPSLQHHQHFLHATSTTIATSTVQAPMGNIIHHGGGASQNPPPPLFPTTSGSVPQNSAHINSQVAAPPLSVLAAPSSNTTRLFYGVPPPPLQQQQQGVPPSSTMSQFPPPTTTDMTTTGHHHRTIATLSVNEICDVSTPLAPPPTNLAPQVCNSSSNIRRSNNFVFNVHSSISSNAEQQPTPATHSSSSVVVVSPLYSSPSTGSGVMAGADSVFL